MKAVADEFTAEGANEQLAIVRNRLTQYDGRTALALSEADAEVDARISSEVGVVEEIYCENFMCHRKLRVTLSPHGNFITGENGSGKSAIIAALQVCFGSSAHSTHRGKSLKSLIRHGFDGNALVRVTLRNDDVGSDAFRPEKFGRKIIVERVIRRDGSGEYCLRGKRGVLVSKLKKDVEAMMDHLNIQTENPCAILDQDSAKLFLKGSSADKYKFFLQATELDKMRTTFANIDEESKKIAESTLVHEKNKVTALKDAVKEAKKQLQQAQGIEKLESYLGVLKAEFEWSLVSEKEGEVAKVEAKIAKRKADTEQAAARNAVAREEVEKLEKRQNELNAMLEEISKKMDRCSNRKTELRNKIRELRRPLHQKQSEVTQLEQSKQRETERLARLQHALVKKKQEHEELLRQVTGHNLQDRLERKRKEAAQTQQHIRDAELWIKQTSEDADELEERHLSCLSLIRESEDDVRHAQYRLNSMKKQKSDSFSVFGNHIAHLQELIKANLDRFTEPPIGPVGKYVTLPKEFMRFAVAIEVALKGTLRCYLVVNGQDKELLDDLKRQARCQPREAEIIIAQRCGFRYQNLEVAGGDLAAHAMCNVLNVKNDDVFNALIDVCSLESKLLFDDREVAERNVLNGPSGHFRMVQFVSEVYLPNGDKFVVREGNLAYIANKVSRRRSIICEDVESEIRGLEQHFDARQRDLQGLRLQVFQLRAESTDLHLYATQEKDRVDNLSRRYHRQCTELHSLEEEFSDQQQEHTLDTTVLEGEISDVQEDLASLEARGLELRTCIAAANQDLNGPLDELEDVNAEENKIAAELNDPQRDANETYKQLTKMKSIEIMSQRQVEASQALAEQLNQHLRSIQEDRERQVKNALRLCTRPANILPRNTYEKRVKQVEHQLASAHQRLNGLSLSELKNDMELKEIKYKTKKANYDKFRQNLLQIRSMLAERKETWDRFRAAVSRRTANEFSEYMRHGDFAGKLKFRHSNECLEITVLQNEKGATSASQMTDMKELSGGERSYTQVALLLALGKITECPFRIMDEFDVFMDSVNRDMTIQLLVEAAKNESKKQFIFVTPNNLSILQQDPMVKVQTMDPPRDRERNSNAQ
ncbi:hypothetical protein PR003_g17364 [Phytophthora rubi]|uniref:RecF/RecN/SMC N-terminal domain-containing protein n=1 Tax=Phytophthora rubi TaxID=129364 RepID=A0A6A4E8Z5_9STRA|nr:hypothetical protein PR003_g17364 [Phytophthora rubi]